MPVVPSVLPLLGSLCMTIALSHQNQRPASVFGATVTCGFLLTAIGYGAAAWVVARAVALGAR